MTVVQVIAIMEMMKTARIMRQFQIVHQVTMTVTQIVMAQVQMLMEIMHQETMTMLTMPHLQKVMATRMVL